MNQSEYFPQSGHLKDGPCLPSGPTITFSYSNVLVSIGTQPQQFHQFTVINVYMETLNDINNDIDMILTA